MHINLSRFDKLVAFEFTLNFDFKHDDLVFQVGSLKGKVTLITGASSGIGAGAAVLFSRLGAQLALNGRDLDNLTKVAKECEACGAVKVKLTRISSDC